MVRHFYECRWRSFKIFFETLNEVGRAIITTF